MHTQARLNFNIERRGGQHIPSLVEESMAIDRFLGKGEPLLRVSPGNLNDHVPVKATNLILYEHH